MIPLIIDQSVRDKIATVKQHASRNVITKDDMLKSMKTGSAPGDDPAFEVMFYVGFRAVYTQEEHPVGLCHHLSVSLNAPGRAPSPDAVQMIMDEFGFGRKLTECVVWLEQQSIVNVVAPVSLESKFPPASSEAKA